MIIGYARVSTDGQTPDAQHAALIAAGAERVFAEKVSGAVSDRKALAKAIAAVGVGDVLLSLGLIGSHAQLAICSMCSTLSAKQARGSGRWRMLGPTPQRPTEG